MIETADKFAKMWRTAREDAGVSQKTAAKLIGVSQSTIQHWEEGTSSPSQLKGFEYFKVLGLNPLSYYFRTLFPNEYKNIYADSTDEEIEDALIVFLMQQTPATKRRLLFWSYGDHGSSIKGSLNMFNAYLCLPLKDRYIICQNIVHMYEIAQITGTLNKSLENKKHIKPDIESLKKALLKAKDAVFKLHDFYTDF